ncbi:hypothetical protein DPMN_154585 [Dreissena polymorpha]|uniref:Uncharacterized protein n=1 Tax=Dreissena polymorpha TaxID=45954 RepID=A0A9D4FS27_DREPO|nr:hypothetical protein DPMN_154585 [Dreissena polymorpha]
MDLRAIATILAPKEQSDQDPNCSTFSQYYYRCKANTLDPDQTALEFILIKTLYSEKF